MKEVFSKGITEHLEQHNANFQAIAEKPVAKKYDPRSADAPKIEQSATQIYETSDYSKFILMTTNREVDNGYVKKLVRLISERNLLHLHPLLVNARMEVIDGQHRLLAAKLLGVPIYYMVDPHLTDGDISTINSVGKKWVLMDYINHYHVKGYPAYIQFAKFCNKHAEFNAGVLIALCSSTGKRNIETVKRGELDVSNLETAEAIIGYVKDFATFRPKIAMSTRFIEAIAIINATGQYDHKRMIDKLSHQPGMLEPCVNTTQYIKMLQELYNYRARTENVVLFIKR